MEDRELQIVLRGRGLGVYADPEPKGRSRVCFLVHGYNVSPPEAKASFDRLLATMRWVSDVPSLVLHGSWRVNWEGYARSWRDTLARGTLSFLSYANQIAVATR